MVQSLKWHPPRTAIKLKNTTCVYCGTPLTPEVDHDVDHVVARRFVPTGSLNAQWNLFVRACRPCNVAKSRLEDEVAAVTMQPNVLGRHVDQEPMLRESAQRKGRGSTSSRTRKPVAKSQERFSIKGHLGGGATLTFGFVSAPQLDHRVACLLARYQLLAFFYFITYDEQTRQGRIWPGCFASVALSARQDWGNGILRGFQDAVAAWPHRIHGATANGYFKVVIRRAPGECLLWAWALEWNANYRLVGFFGAEDAAREAFSALPRLEMQSIHDSPAQRVRYRKEVPLRDSDDKLFDFSS